MARRRAVHRARLCVRVGALDRASAQPVPFSDRQPHTEQAHGPGDLRARDVRSSSRRHSDAGVRQQGRAQGLARAGARLALLCPRGPAGGGRRQPRDRGRRAHRAWNLHVERQDPAVGRVCRARLRRTDVLGVDGLRRRVRMAGLPATQAAAARRGQGGCPRRSDLGDVAPADPDRRAELPRRRPARRDRRLRPGHDRDVSSIRSRLRRGRRSRTGDRRPTRQLQRLRRQADQHQPPHWAARLWSRPQAPSASA